jgi:hypothetical protein
VVNSTSPTDSSPIGRMFCRKLITELCHAAPNSSGGRTKNRMTSGSSSNSPTPGTKDAAIPATTSSSGADSFSRRARPASAAATATSTNTSNCTAAPFLVRGRRGQQHRPAQQGSRTVAGWCHGATA